MCWIGTGPARIAERDIVVYKLGYITEPTKKFQSLYLNYGYYPKGLNKVITLVPITCGVKLPQLLSSDLGIIYSGYHSYKSISLPFNRLGISSRFILLGNIMERIQLYNSYYIATFIIPKGSTYYENSNGELVSSNIIYTGKYLKLQTMCWVENIRSLDLQIADKDIEVYKIISDASKQSCKSIIQGFTYKANIKYEMSTMKLERTSFGSAFWDTNLIYITEAYHSYTKIRFTLKKPYNPYSDYGYKGIIAGNLLMPIRIDNPYYVATFVIPKGSQYAINWKDEIVSNQIVYTGKYLKL